MAPLALCASFPSIGAGCRPLTRDQSDGSASHGEAHSLAQHHADNVGSARAERPECLVIGGLFQGVLRDATRCRLSTNGRVVVGYGQVAFASRIRRP